MGKGHKFLWTRKTCQLVSIYKRKKKEGETNSQKNSKKAELYWLLTKKKDYRSTNNGITVHL